MKYLSIVLLLISGAFAQTYVAILETMSQAVSHEEKVYVTDKIRGEASNVLPSGDFMVMTRENITQMLPPGKTIEECVGSCLVETGKNIAADYIAQGRITKVGSNLALVVELYSTADNNLIKTINIRVADIDAILNELEKKAPELFQPLIDAKRKAQVYENSAENIAPLQPSAPTQVDNGLTPQAETSNSGFPIMKVVSIGVAVAGAALVGTGILWNSKVDDQKKTHRKASLEDEAREWDKLNDLVTQRNIFYGIGAGILAAGVTMTILF